MFFNIIDSWGNYPPNAKHQVFLTWDNWNDYSFLTLFGIFYVDEKSEKHDLGGVKIGHYGQVESERRLTIGDMFENIDTDFFSIGTDVEYYIKLNNLGEIIRDKILIGLKDIARDNEIYAKAILENVTKISFLRNISDTTITGQFRRLANGGRKLTPYYFKYLYPIIQDGVAPMELTFNVIPYSNPPSNIHILIGRNGVGKTFLINNMINSLTNKNKVKNNLGNFISLNQEETKLFANLICITFSAFDDFKHPQEERDKSLGIKYSYIGLKEVENDLNLNGRKSSFLLQEEFVKSIIACKNNSRVSRWKRAINILESDPIFRAANIISLIDNEKENDITRFSEELFNRLSSGHKIVLLTITRLVETIEERSLLLIDEPEAHLHPPLLSSFIRAISDLLINMNGVSIMATHSPVILQEVPRSCVWKLRRDGAIAIGERLQVESFGENVGVLTQEVFGLEVTDSGFHKLLKELLRTLDSYDEAIELLENQVGIEGKAILRSLFYQKGKLNENDF